MPRRRRTNLGSHTSVQRRCRCMRSELMFHPQIRQMFLKLPRMECFTVNPINLCIKHSDMESKTLKTFLVSAHCVLNAVHCTALKCPNDSGGVCCNNGKIDLRPLPQLPQPLAELFAGNAENPRPL